MGNDICASDDKPQTKYNIINIRTRKPLKNYSQFQFIKDKKSKFGDLICKKQQGINLNQYFLQIFHTQEKIQRILVGLRIFGGMEFVEQARKVIINLDSFIRDENILNQKIYLSNDGLSYYFCSFDSYDDDIFKRMLHKINIMRIISKKLQTQKNVHHIIQTFVVQSPIKKKQNDKCIVIVLQEVSISLAQIIAYKKTHSQKFTPQQMQTIVYDIIIGLRNLHRILITHNDLRPSNIFYSTKKKCYLIGGFNYSTIHQKIQLKNNQINGVPYYKSPEVRQQISAIYEQKIYNQFSNDVYSLGLNIAGLLFINNNYLQNINISELEQNDITRNIINLVQIMLQKQSKRLDIEQIFKMVQKWQIKKQINQNRREFQNIQQKKKLNQIEKIQLLKEFSQTYNRLFMYKNVIKIQLQLLSFYQAANNKIQIAQICIRISESISNIGKIKHKNNVSTKEYLSKAINIYIQLAQDALKQYKMTQTQFYLKTAIQYLKLQQNDQFLKLKSLILSSKLHRRKKQFNISQKLLQEAQIFTLKLYGKITIQHLEILIFQSLVRSQLGEYKNAQNKLKNCLNLCSQLSQKKQNENKKIILQRLKIKILEILGINFLIKARNSHKKLQNQQKSSKCLNQALNKANTTNKNELWKIYELIGHFYYQDGSYNDILRAKKQFQKSLLIKRDMMMIESSLKQKIELGELHIFIGRCEAEMGQFQKGIQQVKTAIQIFRQYFGNSNQFIGWTFRQLEKIYEKMNKVEEVNEYKRLRIQIFEDLGINIEQNEYKFQYIQW